MSLVQSLLDFSWFPNRFVQDPNPEWLKINHTVLGESPEFGYKAMRAPSDGGIGALLRQAATDTMIVVVNYNWDTQEAYVKTGFRLATPTDAATKQEYTAFVYKARLRPEFLAGISPSPTPPAPNPPPAPSTNVPSDFVAWNKATQQFMLNNKNWVPVGFNAYWMGLTERYAYPTRAQITQMFQIAVDMRATIIRSHTLGFSSGSGVSLLPKPGQATNPAAWEPIDFAYAEATRFGIKLMCPLTDAYNYYHGNYGDYTAARGLPKSAFWNNATVVADFKKYIHEYLNHRNPYTNTLIKDSPALAFIELGNELGNIRTGANSTTIPTVWWLTEIANYIKSIDTKHLVLDGSDECLAADHIPIRSLDSFSAHFYGNDSWRLQQGAKWSKDAGKPYLVGEYSSGCNDEWFRLMETTPGIKGSMFWSLYPNVSGQKNTTPVLHSDGFTINWIPQDLPKLVRLSNHFRRMQRLPTVSSL